MTNISSFLDEYLLYFTRYAPTQLGSVIPAKENQLDELQETLGVELPQTYRDLITSAVHKLTFSGNFELMSVEETIRSREMMNKHLKDGIFDDGRIEHHKKERFGNWDGGFIQEVWWHPLWLPFAEDGCGNMKCIDLAPGSNGTSGQIIAMEIQDGQGPFLESGHQNLDHYLEKHLDYLREGRVMIEPEPDGNWIEIDRFESPNPKVWDGLG